MTIKVNPTPPTYSNGSLILIEEDRKYIRYIKPSEITQNPNIIKTRMNSNDCKTYIQKYCGQRGKYVPQVRQRLRDIDSAIKQRDRENKKQSIIISKEKKEEELYFKFSEWVNTIIDCVQYHYYKISEHTNNLYEIRSDGVFSNGIQILKNIARRDIGEALKELPYQYTGLISIKALTEKRKNKSFRPTPEHIFPRTGVGFDLILYYHEILKRKGSSSGRELIPMLFQSCFINKTTEDENLVKLKPFQQEHTFKSPEIAYNKAKIILVQEQEYQIHNRWLRLSKRSDVKLPNPPKFKAIISMEEYNNLSKEDIIKMCSIS